QLQLQIEAQMQTKVKISHILIGVHDQGYATHEAAAAAAREKAELLRKQILAGANFAELARKYSEDPGSAKNGGDLGWVKRGMMVPEFERAAFALHRGQISKVVETAFGFHILWATDFAAVDASDEEDQQRNHAPPNKFAGPAVPYQPAP